MNYKEIVGKDQFAKARDEGFLLSLSNDHNGKNCPTGKQLIKCNMNTVVTMAWGPIFRVGFIVTNGSNIAVGSDVSIKNN